MIIGGVAASLQGQARATEDVDASILLDESSLTRFMKMAAAEGLRPRIADAVAFARRSAVLLPLKLRPPSQHGYEKMARWQQGMPAIIISL
ncbi:MAG: hypothetical protein OJF47_004012 [Nitrospira sp.]|jgi:hypothetical protein|nr:MAG: hypothetical protein OJF47_004012 [Nitrospira sp.]